MTHAKLLILLAAIGCSKSEPAPTTGSAEASASAPAFDVEGFCDATMAVGRPCEGDDELLEGNKIGLCTTTLREALDGGVVLDPALAAPCIQTVKSDKDLSDLRTLESLVGRHAPCRKLLAPLKNLAKVAPRAPGSAKRKKAGESCTSSDECLGRCSTQAGKKCVDYCGSG